MKKAIFGSEFSTGNVTGEVTFSPANSSNSDGVYVAFDIKGMEKMREHAVHIHEGRYRNKSDLDKGPSVLKGHFNPLNKNHGSIFTDDRHAGDLVNNIVTDSDGEIHFEYVDQSISLDPDSPLYIGDRSLVIHAGTDDLGLRGRSGTPYSKMNRQQLAVFGLERLTPKELIMNSITNGNAGRRIATANIQ